MTYEAGSISTPLDICGARSGGDPVLLCTYSPHDGDQHSWSSRQRAGDQPLPLHRPGTPDIQSLVVLDLRQRYPGQVTDRIVAMVEARRELGLARYGSALQAFNGRDGGQDLQEELVDAMVYAAQLFTEAQQSGSTELGARYFTMYERLVQMLQELTELRANGWKL
jgi:hypothetical protein